MSDLRTRPMTPADAPAVVDLIAASEQVDRLDEHWSVEDVHELLANPMLDAATDTLVVERDGGLVAHGVLFPRAPADGAISVSLGGTVHPDHRGRGIGSALVPQLVDRADAYVARRGADLRPVVTADAPSDDAARCDLLESAGFSAYRWSFLMEADLATLPREEAALPEGYTLGTWEDATPGELLATHNRSFVGLPGWTPWDETMWRAWVEEHSAHRPALSLLARDAAGAVAAYVHCAEYDAQTAATGVREAFVTKVGTPPEHRGRGLATSLLRVALGRYRDAGFARAALDVDSENPSGANAVYERVGFRVARRWTNYRLQPRGQ